MSGVSAVNRFLITADEICNYVPGVSIISNLIDLFLKCVCKCLPKSTIETNDYWSHIHNKKIIICIGSVILPVISNILILIVSIIEKQCFIDGFSKVKHSNAVA